MLARKSTLSESSLGDDLENLPQPVPAFIWGFIFLLLTLPLWAVVSGTAAIEWGPRMFGPSPWSSLMVQGVGFFLAVAVILVWPLSQFVWCDVPKRYTALQGGVISTVLLSLPLLAYGYYLGRIRSVEDVHELFITVIPSVAISVAVFEKTRNKKIWAAVLSLSVFVFYFLMNEVLSPFPVFVNFLAHGNHFYYLRTLLPVMSTLVCLFWAYGLEGDAKLKSKKEWLALTVLLFHALTIATLPPFLEKALLNQLGVFTFSPWLALYPLAGILLLKNHKLLNTLRIGLGGLVLTVPATWLLTGQNADYAHLQWFSNLILLGGFLIYTGATFRISTFSK